jgi:hypothetical protein
MRRWVGDNNCLGSGQRKGNNFAAIAATRQMLGHEFALLTCQQLLSEGGEQIGVGVGARLNSLGTLQTSSHDFRKILHLSFQLHLAFNFQPLTRLSFLENAASG